MAKVAKKRIEGSSVGVKPSASGLNTPHLPISEKIKAAFIAALAKTGNIALASQHATGNPDCRRSFRRLQATDMRFAKQIEDSLENFSASVALILNEEMAGTLYPVTGAGRVLSDPKTGEPIWIRKRDPKIVLAMAKKHDAALRELRTSVVVNVDGRMEPDSGDPEIRIRSSELFALSESESAQLIFLARKIYAARQETLADLPRPDFLHDDVIDGESIETIIEPNQASETDPWASDYKEESVP